MHCELLRAVYVQSTRHALSVTCTWTESMLHCFRNAVWGCLCMSIMSASEGVLGPVMKSNQFHPLSAARQIAERCRPQHSELAMIHTLAEHLQGCCHPCFKHADEERHGCASGSPPAHIAYFWVHWRAVSS